MARWIFTLAGVYGLAATLALYATPLGRDTLWLYGFAGAAAATQFAYLLIARDPVRYRMVIPIGIASKLSFAVPVLILAARGAVSHGTTAFGLIDLALAGVFAWQFRALRSPAPLDRPI